LWVEVVEIDDDTDELVEVNLLKKERICCYLCTKGSSQLV